MKSIFATIKLLGLLFALALSIYSCTTEEIDTITPQFEETLSETSRQQQGGGFFDTKEIATMLEKRYGDLGDISAEEELNRFAGLLIEQQAAKMNSLKTSQSTYMLITAYAAVPYGPNGGPDLANRISRTDTLLVQSFPQTGFIRSKTRLASESNYFFGLANWKLVEIISTGGHVLLDSGEDREIELECIGNNSVYDETLLKASITLYPNNTYQGSASVSCRRS